MTSKRVTAFYTLFTRQLVYSFTNFAYAQNHPAHSIEDLADAYHLRWGIETYYGYIKEELQLGVFSGLSPICVEQDFAAREKKRKPNAKHYTLTNYKRAI